FPLRRRALPLRRETDLKLPEVVEGQDDLPVRRGLRGCRTDEARDREECGAEEDELQKGFPQNAPNRRPRPVPRREGPRFFAQKVGSAQFFLRSSRFAGSGTIS